MDDHTDGDMTIQETEALMDTPRPSDGKLADMVDEIFLVLSIEDRANIREATRRLRDRGKRIEGCEIGTMFTHANFCGDSVTVKLPPGGSLYEMLGRPCTVILNPTEPETDDE